MSERDAVEKSTRPATVDSIKDDLRRLGVEPGMTLLVHSSLSAVGWVSGGPVAVVQALEGVLERLAEEGVFARQIQVDVASHSPWVDPLRDDLLSELAPLRPRVGSVPIFPSNPSALRLAKTRPPTLVAFSDAP